MAFDFAQVPLTVNSPGVYVEFDFSQMQSGLPTAVVKVLIVGQMLPSGTASADMLYQITGGWNQAKLLFGQGSMLANMIDAYRQNDTTIDIWAMAVADNGAGVAATGSFAYTGTATGAGTIEELVEDQRIQVGVTVGMTAAQIATAVAAAINAIPDLSVTATAASGTVTVTSRHKGAETNSIYLCHNYHQGDQTPAGIGVTVTAMSGGLTNPDATAIFTALGDAPFQYIIHPWTDAANLAVFENALTARANAMQMNYGVALTVNGSSYASLLTMVASRNSAFAPIAGMQKTPWPTWKMAGGLGAQVAYSATNALGCPYTGLVIQGALPPLPGDLFDGTEREALLAAGVATLMVNSSGQVVIQRMVTTYKTNAQGFPATGLKSLNAILLMFYLSWSQQAEITAKFPNYKLGDDGTVYGPNARVVTPGQIKGALAALAAQWATAGLIEDLSDYVSTLVVQRDPNSQDRVNSFQRPNLINEFNVLASLIQPLA